MPKCSVCGKNISEEKWLMCSECGKVYCESCAEDDPSMSALGICSDCEETWQAEEDLDEEE